jgi:hypothetical protein
MKTIKEIEKIILSHKQELNEKYLNLSPLKEAVVNLLHDLT